MAITSDNEVDRELAQMRLLAENLKRDQMIFSNNFASLPPKERALTIQRIQSGHKTLSTFLDKAKKSEVYNAGTRFALENIKQSLQTLSATWRKIEKNLDNVGGAKGGPVEKSSKPDSMDSAVDSYAQALEGMGHQVSQEQLKEFRDRLSSAYQTAKEKAGRDLDIKVVVQEGGKIKVRMEPK
jgi:hypothetical protein